MNTINQQIKNLRNQNNLSQSDFAKRLGVSRTLIILLEKNKQNPTESFLEKIYKEFNVEIKDEDMSHLENDSKEHIGSMPNGRTKQRVFNAMRSGGYAQKDSAKFVGVNEKTAGVYEKARRLVIDQQINENEELITILKKRADDSKTSVSDLVILTKRLEELFKKREHLKGLI